MTSERFCTASTGKCITSVAEYPPSADTDQTSEIQYTNIWYRVLVPINRDKWGITVVKFENIN